MQPKPFQIEGADFLAARKRALLADEPGVGKSAQIVLAAHKIGAQSVRIIVPGIGTEHWRREFRRWWPGGPLPSLDILAFDGDELRRGLRGAMNGTHPIRKVDLLVPDEAHYAKTPGTQRSLAVFGKHGYGWHAGCIWSASGTPAPNNASELWPMLRAYNATGMDYEQFKTYYCVVDAMGKVRGTREERRQELRDILKPFTLRRLKRDVLPELGEIDVQPYYVRPRHDFITDGGLALAAHAQAAELREQLRTIRSEDLLTFLAGDKEFATLRRYNALIKAPAVLETVLFEIDAGLLDKVVIYGWHKEPMRILEERFNAAGVGAVRIDGDMPKGERDAAVERWKRPDGPKVNISSIIVAGTVLDYTAAHQVIALEMDWVPGNNSQAWQRPHRHGQENPVTVRVVYGTEIDEVVNDVVVRKSKDLAGIFD